MTIGIKSTLCQLVNNHTLTGYNLSVGIRELEPKDGYRRYEPNGEMTLKIKLKQEDK